MKAKIIGVTSIVVLGSAIGVGVYSGAKLEKMYTKPETVFNDKRVALKDVHFDMGILNGQASGVFEFIPDLCTPNMKIEFKFEDTIKRGITGYEINTKLSPISPNAKESFNDHLLNLEIVRKVNWLGNISSHIVVHGNQYVDNQKAVAWSDIIVDIESVKTPSGYGIKNYQINLDSVHIKDENLNLQLDQLKISGHSDKPNAIFANIDGKVQLKRLTTNHEDNSLTVNNMTLSSQQTVKNHKQNTHLVFQIGNVDMNSANEYRHLEHIQFNLAINDLDKSVLIPIEELSTKQSQQCVSTKQLAESIDSILINLAKTGFIVESKNNQIKSNSYGADFNAHMTLDAMSLPENLNKVDENILVNMLSGMKYEFNINIDRGLLKEWLPAEEYAHLDRRLEESKQQLSAGFGLKYDADKIEFYGSQN